MDEFNIPENWTITKLKNLPLLSRGQLSSNKDSDNECCLVEMEDIEKDSGKITFDREIPEKMSSKNIFRVGDVLYGKLRPYLNKCGVAEVNGVCSSEIYVVDPVAMDSKFLAYYLRSPSFLNYASTQTHGARMPRLSRGLFQDAKFPVPPKGEQERIVQKIETCFDKIEETESNLKEVESLLEKYRESLLAKAFRGELKSQDSKDEPASVLLEKIREEQEKADSGKKKKSKGFAPIEDDEKPFETPESWKWVRLGEIAGKVTDGAHHTPKPVSEGFPYILAKQIKDEGINFDECLFLSEEEHRKIYTRANIEKGDILITNIGAGTGTATINEADFEFSIKNVALIKVLQNFTFSKFILFYFRYFRKRIFDEFARGGAQPFISLTLLGNIPFPLAPREEQNRIVELIEDGFINIEKLIADNFSKMEITSKLKESILSKAFEGLLVEQIGSEGTGQDLLEKILATKEVEKPVKKKKKKTAKKKVAKKTAKKKTSKKK